VFIRGVLRTPIRNHETLPRGDSKEAQRNLTSPFFVGPVVARVTDGHLMSVESLLSFGSFSTLTPCCSKYFKLESITSSTLSASTNSNAR
jgi:hypothetical protein